ncbi:MAG: Ig-like domain-containing protein, partial [Dehalococcoidia bacterium]|nr:Ig-like domain-containing protein [Dehalococcoidia bacterium]
ETRLTIDVATDLNPSWSPYGSRIVFISNRDGNFEIYVMDADGSGQTRLTNNLDWDLDPSWSPDGTKIVFTSYRDWNHKIYVMNADGSGEFRLVNPMYTVPENDRIDTVTFATAATARGGVFSSNVWFSIPDTPLKLTDDDRLSVDVILPDGRTTQAADVRWAEGLIKTLALNVRTERPAPPNKAPTVTIASPSAGTVFQTTDSISFTGSATDAEDGSLTGASLSWASHVDGQLGAGGSINVTLSSGPHLITLTAKDSQGAQGSSVLSVNVTVPVPVGPVALPPMDNQAMPHIFVGSATIGGLAAPDGTRVSVWVLDYNAPVGTGTVSGGQYSVKTFKYGGAFAGKTLIFKIADKDTGTTATWESGMATVLDLAVD